MIAFWLATELVDGIQIKGIRSLILASAIYLLALLIGRIVFTVLFTVLSLGLMPFVSFFSYALSAYIALSIVLDLLGTGKATTAGKWWGIVIITISSIVLRAVLL